MTKGIVIRETFTPVWHNHYGESGCDVAYDSLEDAMAVIKKRNAVLLFRDRSQGIRKESVELIMVHPVRESGVTE